MRRYKSRLFRKGGSRAFELYRHQELLCRQIDRNDKQRHIITTRRNFEPCVKCLPGLSQLSTPMTPTKGIVNMSAPSLPLCVESGASTLAGEVDIQMVHRHSCLSFRPRTLLHQLQRFCRLLHQGFERFLVDLGHTNPHFSSTPIPRLYRPRPLLPLHRHRHKHRQDRIGLQRHPLRQYIHGGSSPLPCQMGRRLRSPALDCTRRERNIDDPSHN